jgi:hypothetical protein
MGEYSKEKEDALQRALFFMVPSILFMLSISIYFFQDFPGLKWYNKNV